jgi:hypothetical protein
VYGLPRRVARPLTRRILAALATLALARVGVPRPLALALAAHAGWFVRANRGVTAVSLFALAVLVIPPLRPLAPALALVSAINTRRRSAR